MIVFRCDAGPSIGFGHLVRCRTLAEELACRGQSAAMFGPPQSYRTETDQATFSAWQAASTWAGAAEDARQLLSFARSLSADFVVLDDYRVDESYQQVLHESGMHWLQFESHTDRPILADLVLNSSPEADAVAYARAMRNPEARAMLGPRYAILRPAFRRPVPARRFGVLEQVLVMFGAGDDRGAISRVLDCLTPTAFEGARIVIVSGRHNPNNRLICEELEALGSQRIRLAIEPPDVATLMHESDLAVLAGGTATFEAAACGLPMIIVAIADNQWSQAEGWAELGVAVYAGPLEAMDNARLRAAFIKAADPSCRHTMSKRALELVDGSGVERVAEAVAGARTLLLEQQPHGL